MDPIILKLMPVAVAGAIALSLGGIGVSVDMPEGYIDMRLQGDDAEALCDEVPSTSHMEIEQKAEEGDAVAQTVVRLHDAAQSFTRVIEVADLSITREQACEACDIYRAEYTEDFWAPKYMYWIVADGHATHIEAAYLCDADSVEWCRERLCGRIREALSWIDDSMSDVQKLKALHDWLATHCRYDIEGFDSGDQDIESMSAWGALVGGSAVCSGYGYAFRLLCLAAGIECEYVLSREMDHAWNIVVVDGERYHVDVCWDDPVDPNGSGDLGMVEDDSFLKSDKAMLEQGYTGWESFGPCTDTSYDDMVWKTYTGPVEDGSRAGLDLAGLLGL